MSEAGAQAADDVAERGAGRPQIQKLVRDDLTDCLLHGWRDFRAAPLYGLFFGGLYALGGMAIPMSATP